MDTGETVSASDGERIVRLVAHHVGAEVHASAPRVSAELPETGERFEGLLPPVVAAPTFAIRKPAVAVFTLSDYVAAGIMSSHRANALRTAVAARRNILVAGGTSSGNPDVIHLDSNPHDPEGSLYILKGSLAPGGAVVKASGVAKAM
jgi:type IV secretion system protein TrbB